LLCAGVREAQEAVALDEPRVYPMRSEEQEMPGSVEPPEWEWALSQESRRLGAFAYFLVFLSGVFLLVWRRDDRFVRFHALQAVIATLMFFLAGFLLWALASFPIVGFLYAYLLKAYLFALFLYWLYVMYQAWNGNRYRIPYIGRLIEREFEWPPNVR
jgi:uncharacterized membrane protein